MAFDLRKFLKENKLTNTSKLLTEQEGEGIEGTVKNPETGREIEIQTALKYDKSHPAYKAALQKVKGGDDSPKDGDSKGDSPKGGDSKDDSPKGGDSKDGGSTEHSDALSDESKTMVTGLEKWIQLNPEGEPAGYLNDKVLPNLDSEDEVKKLRDYFSALEDKYETGDEETKRQIELRYGTEGEYASGVLDGLVMRLNDKLRDM